MTKTTFELEPMGPSTSLEVHNDTALDMQKYSKDITKKLQG